MSAILRPRRHYYVQLDRPPGLRLTWRDVVPVVWALAGMALLVAALAAIFAGLDVVVGE